MSYKEITIGEQYMIDTYSDYITRTVQDRLDTEMINLFERINSSRWKNIGDKDRMKYLLDNENTIMKFIDTFGNRKHREFMDVITMTLFSMVKLLRKSDSL